VTECTSRLIIAHHDKVYQAASGGGARIVDKYGEKNKITEKLDVYGITGQRLSAV